jgi:hypothetical protein
MRYHYEDMMTPYETLKSLSEARRHLKPGITFEQLDAIANQYSDNEPAQRLNQARVELFQLINKSQKSAV